MDGTGLRAAADETGTMIAVVDFVMFDDHLVMGFAEFADTQPEGVAQVRLALAGPKSIPFDVARAGLQGMLYGGY